MKTLSRVELVLGAILILIFMVWAFDQCQVSQENNRPDSPPEQQAVQPAAPVETVPTNPTPAPTTTTTQQPTTTQPTVTTQQPVTTTTTTQSSLPKIYTVIDSLNMRDQPFLTSQILMKLPIGTEAYYMGKQTDFTQKININGKSYDEPWVYIKTKAGIEGWLYGGAVRFYKK